MLAIEVAFLAGRYIATSYNSREAAEWPPHPARLYSALVATHCSADPALNPGLDQERVLLEWLERLGPPQIQASAATARGVVTVFVPVNDVALTDVDAEAAAADDAQARLAEARARGNARESKKAQTAHKKAEATLRKAIATTTAVPKSPLAPKYGRRILPDHRDRQPRTFPSVTPDDPTVTFIWPDANPTAEQERTLGELLKRLVRLGHSASLVAARVTRAPAAPTWWPIVGGELSLRVVEAGQLRALEAAWLRHREEEPRVLHYVPQAYSRSRHRPDCGEESSVFADSWLVMRRVEGPRLPITATAGVARAVRKVLLSFAAEPISEILSGHAGNGQPTSKPHLAIVPLPFVGHPHATGTVLGIALVLPREVDEVSRRAVYAAVAAWEDAARQEEEDIPVVQLNLGAAGELRLERVEWVTPQATLKVTTWCGPATVWSSVTPVALDRNPGNLRSRDAEELSTAVAEASTTIRRSCLRIGLPEPEQVDVLPAAPWAGARKARDYPAYPGVEGRTQRVLTHVRVTFDRPVRGPVLLGAGRYVGLGLLRPEVT